MDKITNKEIEKINNMMTGTDLPFYSEVVSALATACDTLDRLVAMDRLPKSSQGYRAALNVLNRIPGSKESLL